MSMGIYIPSTKRHFNIHFGIARFASDEMKKRMIYVVPVGEGDKYRHSLENNRLPSEVIETPAVGIAATRRWIGEKALERGESKFLAMDDDIWFYTRTTPDPKNAKLEYSTPQQVNDMLAAVEHSLDVYAHVGISAREGNNRFDQQSDGPYHAVRNTRTLRALAYQTDEFVKCEHGRVEVMEDFDVNLQLLERGLPNCNLAHWAQGQRQTNAPGGCSTYRTHEVQDRSARKLAELHPNFVKLRQKENKSGGEFGHRTEVTIYWQKAYKAGCAREKSNG